MLIEQDSGESDVEEDSYDLRPIPVYKTAPVRPCDSQSEPQFPLDPSAHEFHPVRMVTDKSPVTVQEPAPVVGQQHGPTMLHSEPETVTTQGRNDDIPMEHGAEEEEPDPEPLCEQLIRRPSLAPRPRDVFTYETLGHPSYQSLVPGVNSVFPCMP